MTSWAAQIGISVDRRGEVPVGVQLAWGIGAALAAGRLRAGDRLPGLRELAGELEVSHNTLRAVVARLEADGVLERRHGTGTFVAATTPAPLLQPALVDQVLRQADEAGVTPRALASALYVTAHRSQSRDVEAEERRILRHEIAVLDRLLVDFSAGPPPAGTPGVKKARRGSHLPSAHQLRNQRDELVARLAAAHSALQERDDDASPSVPHTAARPNAARSSRRPGIAPA
jgi:DNA-binding transcriptional regulator YhcF (GntR family)